MKKRVLIVEDDQDMMMQMEMYFEANGYEVVKAYSQEEAQKVIESGDFDAAVLDLMLENPDSGFILSHKIKQKFPQKPVIIVTSVSKETGIYFDKNQDINNWIKADAIIQKEFRFEQLKKEIEKRLAVK